MKVLYRVVIALIIAACCVWLINYPIEPKAETVFGQIEDPVRGLFAEHIGGAARTHLDERQRLMYDAMYEAISEGRQEMSVPLGGYSGSDIETALFSLLYDCPEFFWVDYADCSYVFGGAGTSVNFKFLYSGEVLESMKTRLDAAAAEIVSLTEAQNFGSEYDKAVFVHDYIASVCEYDKSLSSADMHTSFGALVARVAVCDGYAHAYQLVLRELGIECHYVPGEADGPNGVEGHAWNILKLDGVYTAVDLTWDDMDSYLFEDIDAAGDVTSHTYFGISEEELRETHSVDENFLYDLPQASDNDWFEKYGLSGAAVGDIADGAADMLVANIEKSAPYVEIQLTDRAAFSAFMEAYDGSVIDAANDKLREAGREERFISEMKCFVTAEKGCVLILGTVETAAA